MHDTKLFKSVKVATATMLLSGLVACANEAFEARTVEVGERAAQLGIGAYELQDEGSAIALDEDGLQVAAFATATTSSGHNRLSVTDDEHELAVEVGRNGDARFILDGTVLRPDGPEQSLMLDRATFDEMLLLLAASEDLGLGNLTMAEIQADVSPYSTTCIKQRVCVKWGDFEILCFGVEICVDGS